MCNSRSGGMSSLNELNDLLSDIQQLQVALACAETYRIEVAKVATTLSRREPGWRDPVQDAVCQEHALRATLYAVTLAISEVLRRPPSSHMALLEVDTKLFEPNDGR